MAILGFSHITSEVSDINRSIAFYKKLGFHLKFQLDMSIPPCKKAVLDSEAKKITLAYLIFDKDESCNLELIEHNTAKKSDSTKEEKMRLSFSTSQLKKKVSFEDPDGNIINIFPETDNKKIKSKHYILPTNNLSESSRFYEKTFDMCTEKRDFRNIFIENNNVIPHKSLTFKRCLHTNWDGCLHLVENKNITKRKRYLNELGFHSFCFLVSSAENDIYSKINRKDIIGPLREEKEVDGKRLGFEVGFTYDPDGYPIEYLLLT